MNWKSYVEKTQAKTYVLPAGWDSREKIATDLDCSEERVRSLLLPAIKSGEVEVNIFPVWNDKTKRVERITAYHEKGKAAQAKKPSAANQPKRDSMGHFIRAK